MKRALTLLLLFAVAAQTFNQGILLINFHINRAYIAKNLCENRYRPMLHCNGKCILAKKIKQQEKKDQQNPERKIQNKSEVIFSRSFFANAPALQIPAYNPHSFLVTEKPNDLPSSIFHPPCA